MRRQALKAALRHLCRKHGTSARVEFIRARASTVDYRVDDKTPARILDECRLLPTWSQQMEAAALRWLEEPTLAKAFRALRVLEEHVGPDCTPLYLRDVAFKLKDDALRAAKHLPPGAYASFVAFVRDIT